MLYVGDLHLAVDYALWNIAEISILGRLDIEQNWAVPEVTVTWVLGEDRIIELDVLSHRKVQAHVRFSPPKVFSLPTKAEIFGACRLMFISGTIVVLPSTEGVK